GITILNLPNGCDAGLQAEKLHVFRSMCFNLLDKMSALGARADNSHIAFQHIPELGQLIQVGFAHEFAPPGDPGVIVRRQLGSMFFGVHLHASELVDKKGPLAYADALSLKQNRSSQLKLRSEKQHPLSL